jgi:hypothetical protein
MALPYFTILTSGDSAGRHRLPPKFPDFKLIIINIDVEGAQLILKSINFLKGSLALAILLIPEHPKLIILIL